MNPKDAPVYFLDFLHMCRNYKCWKSVCRFLNYQWRHPSFRNERKNKLLRFFQTQINEYVFSITGRWPFTEEYQYFGKQSMKTPKVWKDFMFAVSKNFDAWKEWVDYIQKCAHIADRDKLKMHLAMLHCVSLFHKAVRRKRNRFSTYAFRSRNPKQCAIKTVMDSAKYLSEDQRNEAGIECRILGMLKT